MSILVINAGSSSIKYTLFDARTLESIEHGHIEEIKDHHDGFEKMQLQLSAHHIDIKSIDAIGHRVVHGGELFSTPTSVDDEVIAQLKSLIPLAPLHNPANIEGIEAARAFAPKVPNIAVFDTAFHQSMPEYAYRYPLPKASYETLHVRRYGFHGSSHEYVAAKAAQALQKPLHALKLITLHIGNGASLCAIEEGRSIDTSMGMTPLEGVMMGTRSGSIDPAIVTYLMRHQGLDADAADTLLNKHSGLKAIAGTNDMRSVLQRAAKGEKDALLARDMFVYRLKKQLGAYMAALDGVDAIVFTGGIGEHSAEIRSLTCKSLSHLGIIVDEVKNQEGAVAIHDESSKVAVLVIATDEELQIALHVKHKLHQ